MAATRRSGAPPPGLPVQRGGKTAAALLLLAAALFGGALTPGAASAVTLISNLGLGLEAKAALSTTDLAQAFTTGSNTIGYTLTGIKLKFVDTTSSGGSLLLPSGTDTVTAIVTDGLASTATTVATLTNPGTWTATSEFTAPSGTTLAANTTYYVIVEGSGGSLAATDSDDEEAGGEAGWSIDDSVSVRSQSTSGLGGSWAGAPTLSALQIAVEGTPPPSVSRLEVTSIPGDNATYGIGLPVEVTVHFSSNVDIAVAPQLELDFDGSAKTAECSTNIHKEERTATTTCIYIVMVDDVDADGIAIGANKLTLPSGTITAVGSTTIHAVLDHAAVAAQSGHKVDGIRPTLSTTGAAAPRTSTDGTQVILTFSEPLATASIPAERFTVTADDVAVPLTPTGAVPSGTTVTLTLETALTSAQTVTVTYTDPPIVDDRDVIQDVTGNAAASFTNVAVVNNAPDPVFGVTTVRIASAAGSDDTYAIDNTVAVQVLFSAPIAVTGTPQLELDFDGAPKPADCVRVPADTGQLWCTVDVAENDVAADGIAIKANALTLPNGATITAVGSTTDHAVLDHAAVAAQSAHTVDGVRPTLVSAATSANGTEIRLRFSEVLRGAAVANITVTINGSPVTPFAGGFFAGSRGIEFNLNPAVAAGDRVTVAIPAATVSDQAGNGNPAQAATPVTNTVPPPMVTPMVGALISNLGQISSQDLTLSELAAAQPFTTGTNVAGYTLTGISLKFNTAPAGTDTGTVRVTDGLESTATLVATMTNPGTWATTSAFTAPSGTTLDPGTTYYVIVDIPGRGRASAFAGMAVDSAAAGWSLGTLNVRASTTWMSLAGRRLQLAVQGQAIPIPAITAVALTSNPGRDNTYAIDDIVKATVTFSEAVDVAGAPKLELDFNGTMKTATCEPETNTTELSCAYDVVAGDVAADGIALHANRLTLPTDSDTIRATGSTTVNAVLAHAGLATNANHTVEGIRPTLVSAATSTDGTKVILTFSENIGYFNIDNISFNKFYQIDATESISGHVVTITLHFFYFIQYGETITLAAIVPGAVRDTAGNRIARVRNRAVTNNVLRPPGLITGVAITSNPGMDGIYLTDDVIEITVTYDVAVAVTGTPRIRFFLRGGTSSLRWADYARGSGSTELVFAYTVEPDDETDADGVKVGARGRAALDLNTGTITLGEPGGADVGLQFTELGQDAGHLINWVRPTLVSAETSIDGTQIILTFSEVLGSAGEFVLPVTLFGVTVDGTAVTLSGSASGRATVLTLELATALTSRTQSVLVSYTARDSVLFPDRAGNRVVEFTNQPVTNTVVPPPTITSVAIVNQPADNTYAIGDSVTASVTFSEAVTVTGNPELALDVGGTPKAAGCLPLTNVVSMLCLYIVMVDDVDADGIAIPANALTLSDGDTIMATATTRHADLTHDAVPADAGATVEAIRPTLVTTGAAAPHTSTDGTKVLLAFDEPLDPAGTGGTWAVEVAGSAVTATAAVAGSRVTLTLATALTAASQVVTVSYTDPNPGNPNDSTVLQDVQGNDAASFTSPVTNRFGSNPRITGVALTSDPGADETYAIGESVEATVTFSDPVDVTGTPQLQVRLTDAGGGATPKNAGCAAATNTVTMVCAYEVEVGVDGEGGIAIATNSVSLNSGTIRATGSTTVNAGLTHDAVVTVQAGHRVDGIRPTLSTAETSRDGTQVLLTFSERLGSAVDGTVTVTVGGTAIGTSSVSLELSGAVVTIPVPTADTVATGETVTVALAADAVTDVAGNGNLARAATAVGNTVPAAPGAPRNLSASTTSTTTPGSIRLSFGTAVGADRYEFRARPTGGSWGAWTPVTQEVTPASETHSFAAGLTPGTTYTLEVQGVNRVGAGPASNQATGTAAAAVEITGVALTSDPGTDQTYGIGENVFATLTFSRPVTIPTDVTARPRLELDFNGTGKAAACPAVTQGTEVTCAYQVAVGDTAPTGIAIRANTLTPNGARFQLGSGSTANTTYAVPLAHRARAAQAGHKVDGVRPTLSTAETSPDGTQVLLTFSEEIHTVTASAITVTVDGTAATLSVGTVSFTGAVLTFPLQPADVVEAGETVTVALAAGAVTDVAGNGNAVLAATTVTNQVGVAWTFTLTDADGTAVTELIEGGASATATVTLPNSVQFDTEQTVQLRWGNSDLTSGIIRGAGDVSIITIPANQSVGSLEISAGNLSGRQTYRSPETNTLTATHGGTQIGSIDLTRVDDEPVPVLTMSAPATVTEGEDITIEASLTLGVETSFSVTLTVTDTDNALSGTPPASTFFAFNQLRVTTTLPTADNSVQHDGAREVTVTLALPPDALFPILGDPSTVTITVLDNDTPPLAPPTLTAEPGVTEATLTWQAPPASTPDHRQPVSGYEYRQQEGTEAFGDWMPVPQSDADTTEFTVTGLTHGTAYTVEVAAGNVAGRGAAASVTTTTLDPQWAFTLTDADGTAVTELIQGGASATATVTITNPSVRFDTEQTVTPKWHGRLLGQGSHQLIEGVGGSTITIPANQASGSLEIRSNDISEGEGYGAPFELVLTATHGGTQIGSFPPITVRDDGPTPVLSITQAPDTVTEGENIEIEIRMAPYYTRPIQVTLTVTDADNALSDASPISRRISANQRALRTTLTAADNGVQHDGAREVTVTLALPPDEFVTLGDPSTVTITVLDNDTPPLAPPTLTAEPAATEATLTWQAPPASTPDHRQPVSGYEYRQQEGTEAFGDWMPVPQSDADTTEFTVTGLTHGTAYTVEVAAVNVAGRGAAASVTTTTLDPQWAFTLTDDNGDPVTELIEGAASATATVTITNPNVRFDTEQTITLRWGASDLGLGRRIAGAGGGNVITISANGSSGSLAISAPQLPVLIYQPPETGALTATHRGTVIGSIDLTRVDDEPVPVATLSAPETVSEGEAIAIRVALTIPGAAPGAVALTLTDPDNALGAPPASLFFSSDSEAVLVFSAVETQVTFTLTAADNGVQHDGAREVTVALVPSSGPPDNLPYTLGDPSTVTITVLDNDTPPLAPPTLTAEPAATEATLTWQAPPASTPDHRQPVSGYEYRQQEGTEAFGDWMPVPQSDADTTEFTVTGLTHGTAYTVEVAAVNVAGRGAAASVTTTTLVLPTIDRLEFTSDPGGANTYAINGKVEVTVHFTSQVDITAAPQLELDFAGVPKTAGCLTTYTGQVTATTTCTYIVAEGDVASAGIAIQADKLTGGTITATGSPTVNADLTYAALAADANHKVDGIRPTLTSAETSSDGTQVLLTFSEPLAAVPGNSLGLDAWTVEVDGAAVTVTASGSGISGTTVTLGLGTALTASTQMVTVSYAGPGGGFGDVEDAAGNSADSFTDQAVANTVPAAPEVTITAGDAVTEGAAAVFTLTRTGATTAALDVTVTVSETRARDVVHDADEGTKTVRFRATQATTELAILTVNDALDEFSSTVTVTVAAGPGYTAGTPSSATVAVSDDDAVPTLSVADASVVEGDAGTTVMMEFTSTLSAPSGRYAEVKYYTADGTATAGADFTGIATGFRGGDGLVSFPAGVTEGTIRVTVRGDDLAEEDETFEILFNRPENVDIESLDTQVRATGTIEDDDARGVTVTPEALVVTEGGTGTYTVGLTSAPTAAVTVTVTVPATTDVTVDTDAVTAGDQATLTFTAADWATPQTVTVSAAADADLMHDQAVTLTHAVTGGDYGENTVPAAAVVVTVVETGTPTLSLTAVTAAEDAGTLTFTVRLSTTSSETVTVDWATADGTATAGSDYTAGTGTLTFPANSVTPQTLMVAVTDDDVDEADETITMTLSNAQHAALAGGDSTLVATGTITDDDARGVTVTPEALVVTEGGTGTYTVGLTSAPTAAVTVTPTVQGSADVTVAPAMLTFTADNWATAQPVTVTAAADADAVTDTATITHTVSGGDYGTVPAAAVAAVAVTVQEVPVVTIAGVGSADLFVLEGQNSIFELTRTGDTTDALDVTVTVSETGAVVAASAEGTRTVRIPAGRDFVLFNVPTDDDAVAEANSLVTATIVAATSAPPTYRVGTPASGTNTTWDDESLPVLTIADASIAEGDPGEETTLTFTVTLSSTSTELVIVHLGVDDVGSATADRDFVAVLRRPVHIVAGTTTTNVSVSIIGDDLAEEDETFEVRLNRPNFARFMGASTAVGTILDDDAAPVVVGTTAFTAEENSTAEITTLRATDADTTTSLGWSIVGGADQEHFTLGARGGLSFTTAQDFENPGDAGGDGTYNVTVAVTDGTNPVTADLTVTLRDMVNEDSVVRVRSAVVVEEGGALQFPLIRTRNTSTALVVNVTVSETGDVVAAAHEGPQTVTFAPGDTQMALTVATVDDAADEAASNVTVTLVAGPGYSIGTPGTATVMVPDNDEPVSALTLSPGPLTPAFAPATLHYTARVDAGVTQVTVTATPTAGAAVAYLDNSDVALTDADGGTAGFQVALSPGPNRIKVTGTAGDGTTTRSYTITVTRAVAATLSSDATLRALTLSPGTLVPAFDSGTTNDDYTATVAGRVTQITLTTTPPAGATVAYLGTGLKELTDADAGTAGFQVTVREGAQEIRVRVRAENGATRTYTVTVTRLAVLPPGPPTGLTAETVTTTTIVLLWTAPANDGGADLTGYRIEWSANGSTNWALAGTTADGATTTFTHTGRTAGTPYYYRVRAANGRDGAWSAVLRAATLSSDATLSGLTLSDGTLAPAFDSGTNDYTATVARRVAQITVTATPAAGATVAYTDDAGTALTDADAGTDGVQVALDLGPNTITMTVTAEDGTTMQPYTLIVTRSTTLPPGPPAGLTATPAAQAITLAWTAPVADGGADLTGYRIEWSADGSTNWALAGTVNATTTTFTHTGRTAGTPYYYRVRAANAETHGDWSAVHSAAPAPNVGITFDGNLLTGITEGQAATFTLTRTAPLSETLDVMVHVSATSFTDEAEEGERTASFVANSATATLSIPTLDDEVDEPHGSLTVRLTVGAGYVVDAVDDAAVASVSDDDATPVIITSAALEAEENSTATIATLAATDADTVTTRLTWTIVVGADGNDFTLTSAGALSFTTAQDYEAPGDVGGDGVYDVQVAVTDGDNTARANLTVTLQDVAEPPVVTITAGDDVTEGEAAVFTLTRTEATATTLTVSVTVAEARLFGGYFPVGRSDVVAAADEGETMVTFLANSATAELSIPTVNDADDEDGSTVTVSLTARPDYTVGTPASARLRVSDDDVPVVTIAAGDAVTEGEAATFTLTRTGLPTLSVLNVTVTVAEDGDVVAPADEGAQTVTFARDTATATLSVATDDDVVEEDASVVTATVGPGTGIYVDTYAVGPPASATVTVSDNEGLAPTIDRLEFTSDSGGDNTYAINGKVQVTVHFSSQVDITAAPQLELDFDGVPKTAGCITDEMATATTTCTYIVAEGDVASAGIAIQANKLTGGTITATGSPTVNADLTYAALAADANHKVDGIRPTLTSAETSSDGTQVLLTFSEPLAAVPGNSLGLDAWTVEVDGAAVTVTASGSGISGTTVTLGLGTALTASTQMVTVSYAGPGGGFGGVEDVAGNSADSFTDQAVTNTVPAAPEVTIAAGDAVTEGAAAVFTLTRTGATTAALAVTVTVAEDGAMVAPADEGAQTVTFAIGDGTATLNVATVNDAVAEAASTVTAALGTGTGYRVGTPGSASLTVSDNDAPPPVVSTDATLSALTLSPGTLSPAFLPAVTLYGATVEPRVAQITVTLTPAAGAMVAYTDGAGAVLTDVDGLTAGLQVALDEGANTITITVTAEDGMTMQTYTVTVTREAATAPGQPTGLTVGTVTTNSIMLSWTAPANDGGADLAHYRIEWSADGSTNWTLAGTTADGATTTFTHTGRTAGTPYHYRVRAHNGRDGAWSATVSATTTAAVPSAPTIDRLEFTSDPGSLNTYGINGRVEVTVHFSSQVDITGAPQLELDFDGVPKTAGCVTDEMATATTTCTYIVAEGDVASAGIAIQANKLTGGTITATGSPTVNADLTYAALAADANHTVEAIRPTLITTGTDAPTTSTDGDLVILTFSKDISAIDGSKIKLYVSGTTLVSHFNPTFSGKVVTLDPGGTILATSPPITVVLDADAVADAVGNGNLAVAATTVINAFTTAPTVNSIAFNSAGADGAYKVGDAVEATVTFSEAVTVDTMDGTPQLTIDVGGTDKVLDYSSGSGAAALVFSGYTVAANDEDTDGISIAANKLDANSGTIKATADATLDAVLTHAAVADSASHKVDGVKPTVASAEATEDSLTIKFSEALDENSTPATSAFTLNVDSGTAPTISSVAIAGRNVTLSLSAAVDTSKTYTIDYTAPMTSPLQDEASNPAAAFSDHPVTNEVPATAPDAPTGLEATPGDGSVTLRWTASAYDGGSEVTGHQYRQKTTGGFGSWQDIELSAPGEANATSYPVASLMNDTAYTFEVQARNAEGASGPSNQARATPVAGDSTAPMLRSATTTALALGLTYDENLDADSEPAPSAFTVTVDGVPRAVTGVSVDGAKVLLTLASAVRAGETVTVSYTVPGTDPLRDEASNPAAAFAGHPVTNETPATAPDAPSNLEATPGDGSVTLRWTAPYDGGRAVTGHQYCREEGPSASCTAESDWRDIADSAPGGANATGYTVSDLTNGTGYTFRVRARNAEGASAPSPAAGTTPDASDTASSELVRALSAGFGRMVGSQALSMVSAHLEGGGGTQVTVGGERLGGPAEAALARLEAAARDGDEGRTRAGREVLHGSSFRLQSGGEETGAAGAAAWGRIAAGRFETRSDGVATGGEVTTGMVGADVTSGRWLVGGALSHARGKGSFASSAERAEGESEVRLTTVHPYARVRLGERMSAWGLAGYGKGELALSGAGGKWVETGLRMRMGAVGARGTLVPAPAGGGFELALKTDALWMRVISDAAEGLPGERADARRLRLVLDASRVVETAGGATLTPRFEAGVRRDGGDTERGAGLEVGAGLRYARSAVTVEGRVRALALHEASGYEEWGASGSVRVDPSASGRGLSLTLAPAWGNAASAVERLWSLRDPGGLAANADFEPRARFAAELGYGLRGPRGVGVATPYAGLGLAREGGGAWRAGARWKLAPDFTLGLEATRREPSTNAPPEHRLMLRGALRW